MTSVGLSSDLFRFLTVRPPAPFDPTAAIPLAHAGHESALHLELRRARAGANGRADMLARAGEFIGSDEFVADPGELATAIGVLDDRLGRDPSLDLDSLRRLIEEVFGTGAGELTASPAFQEDRRRTADSLLALAVAPGGRSLRRARLVRAMRILSLVERVAAGDEGLNEPAAVERALARVIALPDELFPLPRPAREERGEAPAEEGAGEERAQLRQRLDRLEAAWGEVLAARPGPAAERVRLPAAIDADALDDEGGEREPRPRRESSPSRAGGRTAELPEAQPWLLSPEERKKLSRPARQALEEIAIPLDAMPVQEIAARIEAELARVSAILHPARTFPVVVPVGDTYQPAPAPADGASGPVGAPAPVGSGSLRPVGIADLMIVRQQIKRYEMGEVAHIENVLQGESKERTHRRSRRTEETFLLETERTEESERDLQSAERFELQRETSRTIEQDTKLDAGVTVTASYGPSVEVTAHTDVAMENSKEESDRIATSYSRDVTERSLHRLQERVREERTRRTIEEFEETNRHGVDNAGGADHVVGIYRWVDKIYRAQVVNYGRRMMFEFVVPEPAAFLLHVLRTAPAEGAVLEKPEPPVALGAATPLRPADITRWNYQHWVTQYNVADVAPPPDLFTIATYTYKTEAGYDKKWKDEIAADRIPIPDGYSPQTGFITLETFPGTYAMASVILGRWRANTAIDWFARYVAPLEEATSIEEGLPITVHMSHRWHGSCAVEVLCRLTDRAMAEWQAETYEAIVTAYTNLKARYDEQLAATAIRQGVGILGRNPAENRDVERTELRKAAIALLTGAHLDLDAIEDAPQDAYPQPDLGVAKSTGDYVQFFEQAFEWPQLTYLFYPYFWARRERWPLLRQLQDTDPLHAQFLQAGAARVLVPVRPGYEGAILHFLATDVIWSGGGPPEISDPEYLPLVQELKEQQGTGFDGVAVGEPWDVRVPTDLVVLQPEPTLPEWTLP